jgi:hypothetical protein
MSAGLLVRWSEMALGFGQVLKELPQIRLKIYRPTILFCLQNKLCKETPKQPDTMTQWIKTRTRIT